MINVCRNEYFKIEKYGDGYCLCIYKDTNNIPDKLKENFKELFGISYKTLKDTVDHIADLNTFPKDKYIAIVFKNDVILCSTVEENMKAEIKVLERVENADVVISCVKSSIGGFLNMMHSNETIELMRKKNVKFYIIVLSTSEILIQPV